MVIPLATKLIQCNKCLEKGWKQSDFVNAGNGCLYGIPYNARRIIQFNEETQEIKEIGPDLGVKYKYWRDIRADNGSIYCMPFNVNEAHILKIIPMEGQDAEVCILNDKQLPEEDDNDCKFDKWRDGALAKDGCIYYLPYYAARVLKL